MVFAVISEQSWSANNRASVIISVLLFATFLRLSMIPFLVIENAHGMQNL